MAKGRFTVQFVGKQEPNRAKDKTKFHYLGIICDDVIEKDLATEFDVLDFWSEDDMDVKPNKLYLCTLDCMSTQTGQIIKFCSLNGEI